MLSDTLQSLFTRDLNRLRNEIELYRKEENIWRVEEQIANSAGNLCLHLVGNLNTHIGQQIGKTGYVRNRELEFSIKNVSKTKLLIKIDETRVIVDTVLATLDDNKLAIEYPILVFEERTSTGYMLVHLATHLSYHLGQINYHRRLLDR